MCYSDDARPPLPPVGGAASDHGDFVLTASDGNKFAAHFARAAKPTGAGMVVMPDVRGLHEFYKELARRFAEAGIDAVAIDYFGRTAGIGDRGEGFEYMPHVEKTTQDGIRNDVAAAVAYLRSKEGGAVLVADDDLPGEAAGTATGVTHEDFHRVGPVGELLARVDGPVAGRALVDLGGSIGFYGRPERSLGLIGKMQDPLLLLVAGADFTPQEAFHDFDRRLSEANVPHEMHIYDGAPHSFFDRTFAEWKDYCDDAWRRMLGFIDNNSKVSSST